MSRSKDILQEQQKLRRAFLSKTLKLMTAIPAAGLLASDLTRPAYADRTTTTRLTTSPTTGRFTARPTTVRLTTRPTTARLTTRPPTAPPTTLRITNPRFTTNPSGTVPEPSTILLVGTGIAAASALASRLRIEAGDSTADASDADT